MTAIKKEANVLSLAQIDPLNLEHVVSQMVYC